MAQNLTPISFIKQSLAPFKWWIGGQFFVAFIWAIDLSLRPYILKVMLDRMPTLIPSEAIVALGMPALLYILLTILHTGIFRFYDYVWLNLNPFLKRHLGLVLMDRMMGHSYHFYQNQFAGNLANKIKEIMSGVPDLLKTLIDRFFSHGLALMIAIITLRTVSLGFALTLTVWVFVFIGGSFMLSMKAKSLSEIAAEVRSIVVGKLVDTLTNITSVRLFRGEGYEKKSLTKVLDEYVKADQERDWFLMKLFTFQGGTFVIYQGMSFFLLILGFSQGYVTSGDFVLVVTINIAIINVLWNLAQDIAVFAEQAGNVFQGLSIILSPLEVQDKPGAKQLMIQKGEITFENVAFHYPGAPPLFEKKTVHILPGQKVGLVGYSGSGKSTFVNLILRLFDIQNGHIYIDNQDIQGVTQKSLHEAIGVIPQDPSLFHRSLMENIRYGRLDATDEEVKGAAIKALAHDFIEALPHGYNTIVGERGIKLSGGQLQRIAIARALLKNAPILVLDEATSQLDSVTETLIQDSLWNLMSGKTTLVVAHRLSTLLHMDRILVFDQGKIVEDGTHRELIKRKGLYKTLWSAQVDGFLADQSIFENNL